MARPRVKEEPRDKTLVAPLLRALQRLTKDGRLTSRDGRLALLEAIERHATPDDTTDMSILAQRYPGSLGHRP